MTTVLQQRLKENPDYNRTRQVFNPEVMAVYYQALDELKFDNVPREEILVEATKLEIDEKTTPAKQLKKLMPSLKQEYMRHVAFRRFHIKLENDEQIQASNQAIERIGQLLRDQKQQVPTPEDCERWAFAQMEKAQREREDQARFMTEKQQQQQSTNTDDLMLPPAAKRARMEQKSSSPEPSADLVPM